MSEPLTEELLNDLVSSSNLGDFLEEHDRDMTDRSLADYLQQLLAEKNLKQSRVVRMSGLAEHYGREIFSGKKCHPDRDKVLSIALAMALDRRETNRLLTAAGVSELYSKNRRDAIIIFCLDRGCSLQKVNEELYRFDERTVC
ncbi:XRE family transcriptional regulator [Thermophilibacter immobilis]|uniref:XRE family transcriptional regulator n=1 Tax=Thermophilibacter immobilis TaxID=2779519 RepID=A0A7S7M818_9ACTN|nr:XRE family transcriptional regulator [Thermophilibacter immobilis]QOY60404.1 XRE family transcriptional regulator [Thermophilibacter immobilis]